MFITGFIPLLVYVLPAAAGIVLIPVCVECEVGFGLLTYFATSILSLFLTPDKEAAVIFAMFFGFYPVLKSALRKIHPVLQIIMKIIIFNVSFILSYWLLINVLGIVTFEDMFGDFGRYGAAILLLLGNLAFFIYDKAVCKLELQYYKIYRNKILGLK